jgi:protein kinase X
MLAGFPPFFDDNPFGIYEKILACKLEWPRSIDPIAKDLVKKLLVADRTKRLGNMKVNRSWHSVIITWSNISVF